MDIASLGIEIKTDSVQKAADDLDRLNQAGAQSEAAAKGVESAWNGVGQKVGSASAPVSGTAAAFKAGSDAMRQQQAELGKLLGQIDPVTKALGRLDEQQEKLRQFKSGGLLDAETFNEYNTKIEDARKKLSDIDGTIRKTGITSAQTANALRQLPAQFSDIFISLQAGQSPLQVFLQQGSQIKDSFGGVGPALRETARYAAGLINPFTAAAAAVGLLAVAYLQGSQEATEFNKAIAVSGNYAGTSKSQLQGMAEAIDAVTGTQRQAAAALAEFTAAGAFTSNQLQDLAQAAVAWEDATGTAISETVSQFKKLADEPAAASAKLNEQYNYLTASVYEQIKALEDQGDAAGAAQLAIDTFAQTMNERAAEIESGLGLVELAWKGIKDAASESWDAMLGVGRQETPMDAINRLGASSGPNLKEAGGATLLFGYAGGAASLAKQFYDQQIKPENERVTEFVGALQKYQDESEAAWAEGIQKQLQGDAVKAQARIDQIKKSTLTNAEKRSKELSDLQKDLAKIRAVNPNDERLQAENIAKLEANIAEKYKDPKTAKVKAYQDDAATKMLISLREQQSALETQLLTEEKLTSEQKKRAEFESLIADLKEKKVLTADQKSLLANQDAIKAQLDKNVAVAEEVRLYKESIKFQERSAQIQASIVSSQEGRNEQYSRQLGAFGQGQRELERVQSEASIFREFRRYQDQLNKATPKDLLGSDQYKEATQEIKDGLNDALRANEDYYRKLDELRGDWVNGQKSAFADYADSAKDVAGQTYDLFSNAFTGLEDALVDFVMTGKFSFSDLANSIIADLVRIEARKAIAFAIGGSDGSSGAGGLLSAAFSAAGAYFGGGGAAASSLAAGSTQAGYAMDLSKFAAGRAAGGPVAANQLYEVGENNNPEILKSGGKNYLIPGNNGNVVPFGKGGGSQTNNYYFPGITSAKEAKEATGYAARQLARVAQDAGRYT
ncbi:phage tail tape measure protein [Pseudomonas tohonis]|uniref:phage tail tape measure protein n=1 Tax=Pseudomonas tohonis TaxID=2725477 RepID=UPI001F26FD5F|nr:phage tail tape measure protein [Pseudomonas tohonis]